jgi:hypothetical protein
MVAVIAAVVWFTGCGGSGTDPVASDAALVDGVVGDDASTPDASPDGGVTPPTVSCVSPAAGAIGDLGLGLAGNMWQSGDRMVSTAGGPWALWDLDTRRPIMRGTGATANFEDPEMRISGPTFAVGQADSVELRATADGALLATVPVEPFFEELPYFGLASDGSFLWTVGVDGLSTYDLTGALIWRRAGYHGAASSRRIGATTDTVRVAGAAGVEVIQVPTGVSTLTPVFSGDFEAWFDNGERFLTKRDGSPTVMWVYSKDAVQEQLVTHDGPVEEVGTVRDHFWARTVLPYGVAVYAVGTAAPIATLASSPTTEVFVGHDCIGALEYSSELHVARLGGTPNVIDVAVPVPLPSWATCTEAGALYVAASGVVMAGDLDASPVALQPLNCGNVTGVAGSPSGTAVIATASGQVLIVDAEFDQIRAVLPLQTSKVQLTEDGLVLASGSDAWSQYWNDRSIRIVSTAPGEEGTPIATWPYTQDMTPQFMDYEMARAAPRLTQLLWSSDGSSPGTNHRRWTNLDGSEVILSTDIEDGHRYEWDEVYKVSPDGTRIAAPTLGRHPDAVTILYDGPTPTGAVDGFPVGWIDNDRILLHRYSGPDDDPDHASSVIVNAQGIVVGSPSLPELRSIAPVTGHPEWIHGTKWGYGFRGRIYELATGQSVTTADSVTAAGTRELRIDATGRITAPAF